MYFVSRIVKFTRNPAFSKALSFCLQRKTIFKVSAIATNLQKSKFSSSATRFERTQKAIKSCQDTSSLGVDIKKNHLLLDVRGEALDLNFIWLRDHCRCNECYDATTFQKKIDCTEFAEDLKPVTAFSNEAELHVLWSDGHNSKYSIEWLQHNSFPPRSAADKVFWDKSIVEEMPLPVVDNNFFMTSDDGLRQHLVHLHMYGFGIVRGVAVNHESTLEVCRRISYTYQTFFGADWAFSNENLDREDTAYTSQFIGPHTDTCYLEQGAGLQILHCLHHDGEGGNNLLIDGFYLANKLRQSSSHDFEILSSTTIPYEFLGDGVRVKGFGPIISIHPVTKELHQIRYNPYDRAALNTVPPDQLSALYAALRKWKSLIEDPENTFWLKLKPGDVLFFDNFRVFHGRSAFSGSRSMSGCYLPRDEWLSKARLLGVF